MLKSVRQWRLGLALLFCGGLILRPAEEKLFFQEFVFQGKTYSVFVERAGSGSDVFLAVDGTAAAVSRFLPGENIAPSVCVGSDNFYLLWVNYRSRQVSIGLFDFASQRSVDYPLGAFSFVSAPQLVLGDGIPVGMLFLANRSTNDDVFYLDLERNILKNISATPVSEKSFSWRWQDGMLVVTAITLQATTDYAFDPVALTLRWRKTADNLRPSAEKTAEKSSAAVGPEVNNFIAFGDSITWGKMRMLNLVGEYHPELAYPALVQKLLQTSYGDSLAINLGVPSDATLNGVQRVDSDLAANPAGYFLLMLGTNDVISNLFSVDSSLENLEYIIDAALSQGLNVVVSTIPPRKDLFSLFAYVLDNISALNAGILQLATEKSIAAIDTHKEFMNFNPPDGWKTLLEDTGGNHPSPAGHQVIADLFEPEIVAFPPGIPANVEIHASSGQPWAEWDQNYESDFGHYEIEFGFQTNQLINSLITSFNTFTISQLPFLTELFFRVRSVDQNDNQSEFTPIYSTIP